MQKDHPPSQDESQGDYIRKDHETNPDFNEKWGVDPDEPYQPIEPDDKPKQ